MSDKNDGIPFDEPDGESTSFPAPLEPASIGPTPPARTAAAAGGSCC
jgi:hypothetical protein